MSLAHDNKPAREKMTKGTITEIMFGVQLRAHLVVAE